jgi:hypothetical protein
MANGTIAFDTLQTSGQIESRTTGLSIDTDYLVHGSNKAWTNILYTSAAPDIQDSLNASSVADTTTGEYTVTLSNNMVNDDYVCVSNQQDFSVEHQSPSLATSTYAIRTIADSSGARADVGNGTESYALITGELA